MANANPRRVVAPHPRSLDDVVGRNLPQWAVDFLVIDLERDYRSGIYLTLKLAKFHSSPHVREMYRTASQFFSRVNDLMSRSDSFSHNLAYRMLSFPEPYEIRLGYAALGSYGSGVGKGELRDELFDALMASKELRKAMVAEPDMLCCVPGIAMDRSSDVVATITKHQLVAFTQDQAAFWKFDRACMKKRHIENAWNPKTEAIGGFDAIVPTDDLGRVFLLVPKEICRSGPPMNPRQYFRDLGPKAGGGASDLTRKEAMIADAAKHPGRLRGFAVERMRDPSRFKPRRELRDPDEK